MSRSVAIRVMAALAGIAVSTSTSRSQSAVAPEGVVDVEVRFKATDGTPLEAKLSRPANAPSRVPVVFYLHGAGPRNADHPVRFRDAEGRIQQVRYCDYFARELARHGVAFFRMSKRGCALDAEGRLAVDRTVFSTATPSVLLDDYAAALDALRQRPEIDPDRIALLGSSEGTRLAPQLTLRRPEGIVGLVLMSYQPDNSRNTVQWQNSIGAWRAVTSLIPAAADGALTRAEYDDAVARDATLAAQLPFARIDRDADRVITSGELSLLIKPRLDAILSAVENKDDDFLWQALLNLTSAYLLEDWNGEPTQAYLLRLEVPIGIFHGELDGTTRVEGARETAAAFAAAGKDNLTLQTYPGLDHDLGWKPTAASGRGSQPFQDALRFAVAVLSR